MCAGSAQGGNGAIRNGLKVFGSGELVWEKDVFGVPGEFRSEFRSFRAFRRRSESLQPLVGFTGELSQLRVWAFSVTGFAGSGKAPAYLKVSSFSRSNLTGQQIFEKYMRAQIKYIVSQTGL